MFHFLFQDLGLEGTSLNDILYKNAAFLNLVDPISHELLLSLAREMQCPKKVCPSPPHGCFTPQTFQSLIPKSDVRTGFILTENERFSFICL